jgi:hypothetical protein
MRESLAKWGAAVAVAAAVFVRGGEAKACGGCFHPVGETPTVVTDHRMIFTIGKDQSTLYDQIRYTGAPSSFAWVLPISGEVTVGLSADVVFTVLDQLTQTTVMPPPMNCPPMPSGCALAGSARLADAGAAFDHNGVDVIRREVVGPYETVQLSATTPNALRDWLTKNGFAVPAEVAPVVDAYVAEKFNFLALKLLPNKGTQDMRPVRVTTRGANVALPLRMVAAGTGATVGISLWVFGEGRYEPQNFPFFVIGAGDIGWDWKQNKSDYVDLRTAKTAAGGGRIWEIESSTDVARPQIESRLGLSSATVLPDGGLATGDYLPVRDAQGNVTQAADAVREEDLTTLFGGGSFSRVTRMRADLAHAALDTDLLMTAAKDQGTLSNVRTVTKELNEPLCPVWNGCTSTEQAPRSEAIARSTGGGAGGESGETFSCGAAPERTTPEGWLVIAVAGLSAVKILRRRARMAKAR